MQDYRINVNYAKALYNTAVETEVSQRVFDDMSLVAKVCEENHLLRTVMGNPVIKQDKKRAMLNELFADKVCDLSRLFLAFVVRKSRAVNLMGIAKAYMDLYREKNGIVFAEIVTASEISEDAVETTRQLVANHTGKKVEIESKVNNKRIGGFYLTFDNILYDARLLTKLARLRREFSKNIYESKL